MWQEIWIRVTSFKDFFCSQCNYSSTLLASQTWKFSKFTIFHECWKKIISNNAVLVSYPRKFNLKNINKLFNFIWEFFKTITIMTESRYHFTSASVLCSITSQSWNHFSFSDHIFCLKNYESETIEGYPQRHVQSLY